MHRYGKSHSESSKIVNAKALLTCADHASKRSALIDQANCTTDFISLQTKSIGPIVCFSKAAQFFVYHSVGLAIQTADTKIYDCPKLTSVFHIKFGLTLR